MTLFRMSDFKLYNLIFTIYIILQFLIGRIIEKISQENHLKKITRFVLVLREKILNLFCRELNSEQILSYERY
jgi:hypothetical protein